MKKSSKLFTIISAILVFTMLLLTFSGCSSKNESALDVIKNRGKLIVGTEACGQNFNFKDIDGNYSGVEIDIAKKLAKEILGDENAVEFVVLTAADRPIMLDSGEVDIVLSTYTITKERLESTDFSHPYFNDNTGLIVLKNSGISALSDLNGKKIGVLQGTAVATTLSEITEQKGYKVEYPEYASYGDLKAALVAGRIDAFASDKSILQTYLDKDTLILDESYGTEPYGIGVKKGSELLGVVNEYIMNWIGDGTMDELIEKNNLPSMDWEEIEKIAEDLGMTK